MLQPECHAINLKTAALKNTYRNYYEQILTKPLNTRFSDGK